MKTQLKNEFVDVLVISNSTGRELRYVTDYTFDDEDRGEYEDNMLSYYKVRSDVWSALRKIGSPDINSPEVERANYLLYSAHTTHCLSYLVKCGFAVEVDY